MKLMKIFFAPMEGITGFVFRNAFHSVFGGVDKYYAPFVSPGPDIGIPKRQMRDISPENNRGIPLVPQILRDLPEDLPEKLLQTVNIRQESGAFSFGGDGSGRAAQIKIHFPVSDGGVFPGGLP